VQGSIRLDGVEQPCAAPFSWLIKSYLQSLWDESEFIPGLKRLLMNDSEIIICWLLYISLLRLNKNLHYSKEVEDGEL
jgi:hypothetical protein